MVSTVPLLNLEYFRGHLVKLQLARDENDRRGSGKLRARRSSNWNGNYELVDPDRHCEHDVVACVGRDRSLYRHTQVAIEPHCDVLVMLAASLAYDVLNWRCVRRT